MGTGRVGELHQQAAEPPGRRGDQHPLPRLDLGRARQAQRGRADLEKRRRLSYAQPVRYGNQGVHRDRDPLGVPSVAGHGDDVAADPAGIDPLSHGGHPPAHPASGHVRRALAEEFGTPAGAELRLERQDVHDGHPHHDLTGSGDRIRSPVHHQYLWPPERGYLDNTHIDHSPSVPSRTVSDLKLG